MGEGEVRIQCLKFRFCMSHSEHEFHSDSIFPGSYILGQVQCTDEVKCSLVHIIQVILVWVDTDLNFFQLCMCQYIL